jgi:hypothetical protein
MDHATILLPLMATILYIHHYVILYISTIPTLNQDKVVLLKPRGFGIREMLPCHGSYESQSIMVLGKLP